MLLLLMLFWEISLKTGFEQKHYKVKVPNTESECQIGLSQTQNLPSNEGMLFIFAKPSNPIFTMKETSLNLKLLFFDSNYHLIQILDGRAFDSKPLYSLEKVQYVLEINETYFDSTFFIPHKTTLILQKET